MVAPISMNHSAGLRAHHRSIRSRTSIDDSVEDDLDADYYQFAYVTNDFGRAIDELRAIHGMGPFQELRDLHLPVGPDRAAIGHFGVAFKGRMQFEVIEPLGGAVDLYQGLVPATEFGMAFHHLGRCFTKLDDYQAAIAAAKAQWAMPIDHGAFGGFFAYADARPAVGHYLEYFCFPDGRHLEGVPHY